MRVAANDDRGADPTQSISDADLLAYVDNRLTDKRRTEVEGFLAANPDLAAKVMLELHLRGHSPFSRMPRHGLNRPWAAILGAGLVGAAAALGLWLLATAFLQR